MVEDIILFPFRMAFAGAFILVAILFVAFWIWMIVDCAKRKFRNDLEKIVWILIIIFTTWAGALVYFIVIRNINPKGVVKHK